MKKYTKAWLSYKMKALTNQKIWSKVTTVSAGELPQTAQTAVKELSYTVRGKGIVWIGACDGQ